MQLRMTAPTLAETRKERPSFEVMSELVFRPLAHPLVRVLLPLRIPPPAVVLAVAVVWIVWRWAKRDEAAQRDGPPGPGSGESG